MNKEKNINIANSIRETKERHSKMDVKTYEVKVITSKLSNVQKNDIILTIGAGTVTKIGYMIKE